MVKQETTLYLGLDPRGYHTPNRIIHLPVIKLIPKDFNTIEIKSVMDDFREFSHLIFTSKNTVRIFLNCMEYYGFTKKDLASKKSIAIGQKTAQCLLDQNIGALVAQEETQEGVIDLLRRLDLERAYLCCPSSSLARNALNYFLASQGVRHQVCYFYDTACALPKTLTDLSEVDEIVFTSPSTVDGFLKCYHEIPKNKKIISIGPVTDEKLLKSRN